MATRGQGGKFDPNLVKREIRRSMDRPLQSKNQVMGQIRKVGVGPKNLECQGAILMRRFLHMEKEIQMDYSFPEVTVAVILLSHLNGRNDSLKRAVLMRFLHMEREIQMDYSFPEVSVAVILLSHLNGRSDSLMRADLLRRFLHMEKEIQMNCSFPEVIVGVILPRNLNGRYDSLTNYPPNPSR